MKRLLFLFSVLLFQNCSDGGGSDNQLQPSNLVFTVNQSDQTQGLVEVEATADNASFYLIDFGAGDEFVRSSDGILSYQYTKEGTYKITVRANASDNLYVEDSKTVTIVFVKEVNDVGYTTPLSYSGYNLIWNDEFDGTTLSTSWKHEIGTGSNGWGNSELQYYRSENTTLNNGFLVIEAKKESFSGQQYTSSRIVTEGKKSFKYGRIDIRAMLPKGQGLWPALWMLGSNFSTVGWPKCGEIDIMEMIGGSGRENNVFGTLHWDNAGSNACTCGQGSGYTLSNGTFNDEFHVFTLIWDASSIKWYVDDNLYHTIDITPVELDEFQKEFFFIFNVAVGGTLPGSPDGSTIFPQQMIVDYVRVFQVQ